ncbi:hypothetical protein F2Q70_00027940 [Brassica cretica]|uniref:GDSL esterase/lipase n=1 Tax=Brassica cretica TaxID=69181 RepID=A0A8S9LAU8_BRACR|nr:hypothetical protein F2Q70_00027940 [Brassica cretica]
MKINILVIVAFSFLIAARSLPVKQTLNYESIFNFGDSLSDTGNFLISSDVNSPSIGRPPYGQTFFNRSTGRCSDGRGVQNFPCGWLSCGRVSCVQVICVWAMLGRVVCGQVMYGRVIFGRMMCGRVRKQAWGFGHSCFELVHNSVPHSPSPLAKA